MAGAPRRPTTHTPTRPRRAPHPGGRGRRTWALAALAVAALGVSACSGDEPSSVSPGLPGGGTTAPPTATTGSPMGGGATIVLPKGTSPPGANPLAPGSTLAAGGSPHGGASSSGAAGEAPQIGEITVPTVVRCPQAGVVQATVDYRTTGADRVLFVVDGEQQPGLAPQSGPTTVAIPCDGASHVLVFTAVAPSGQTTIDTRVLVTRVEAPAEVQTGG